MNQIKENILVIDDDKELCSLLAEYLTPEGFVIDVAADGDIGIEMALGKEYGIIVLDVMLPGRHNGFAVLQNIRTKMDTPILMLTARGDDVDRIVGLEMGADDYLPKPFNPRELLARIHAILRRSQILLSNHTVNSGREEKYKVADVELYVSGREVFKAGLPIELTSVEFDILEVLMHKAGNIVSRDELTKEILGRSFSPNDRSIDVHVSRLRKKLGPGISGVERIKSIRGTGYILIHSSLFK